MLLQRFARQADLFWLPAAFWALFAVCLLLFPLADRPTIGLMYVGYLLPLLAGGLAAYSLLQDEALELLFALPVPAWRSLAERLGIVAITIAVFAASFTGLLRLLQVDLGLGGTWAELGAWALPCLALMSSGFMLSLWARTPSAGGTFVGTLWIVQVLLQEWFAGHSVWRHLLLFLGSLQPENPALPANQLTLLALSVVSVLASIHLLKQQERYL